MPRRVTLTFDNGPHPDVTPMVLDELASRGLTAWFCLVGRQLRHDGGPELARRTHDAGHRLVNHSLTHVTALGDDPSVDHARAEVLEMHNLLEDLVGEWGEQWFRPFGRGGSLGPRIFSQASLQLFADLDYSVMLWNSVPRDWEDIDGWVESALSDIDTLRHTVVVLHDLPTGAMAHLPRFLDLVEQRGIEITAELPHDCVPIRRGRPTTDLTALTTA